MYRCNLTPKQMDEVLEVLANARRNPKDGSVRVTGLSKPAVKYLVRDNWVEKRENGRYYPKYGTSPPYPDTFSFFWRLLPVDLVWRVVEPMLRSDGPTGYSITANDRWGYLNLYRRGQHGWDGPYGEVEQYQVLSELAGHGYVWFLAGGSVWEVTRRKDEAAA